MSAPSMILGHYIPLQSPVHRLQPTLKLVLLLAVMAVLLLVETAPAFLAMLALWLVATLGSGLRPGFVARGLRPLLFLLSLTFLLHLFMTDGKDVLVAWGPFTMTREGLSNAGFFTGRLALLVGFTTLLTLTTSPVELAYGIERLSRPLELFRFPSGEFAMMLTIALRFIPVLFREMDKIIKAQRCRGAPFDRGTLPDRARAYLSILVPLFINSFNRALELATAMEIRGYRPGAPRGQYRRHPLALRDLVATALVVFFGACACLLRGLSFLPPSI